MTDTNKGIFYMSVIENAFFATNQNTCYLLNASSLLSSNTLMMSLSL